MMQKILLDTDIGGDIDDSLCLAYLLAQSNCNLLGITAVGPESEKKAMLASVFCKIAKKDIPIYPGIEEPINGGDQKKEIKQNEPHRPQFEVLKKFPHENKFPKGEAINFLRDTIRKHPNEVVLLAIGPLTNVAILFSIDPEIPKLLKGLVLMCGVFTKIKTGFGGTMENNASRDPIATSIVYKQMIGFHRSIGLDVTYGLQIDEKEINRHLNSNILKPIKDLSTIWFSKQKQEKITFHDPLAATTIFDNKICKFIKGDVGIELKKDKEMCKISWVEKKFKGKNEIAIEVNRDRFFNHFFSVFKNNK